MGREKKSPAPKKVAKKPRDRNDKRHCWNRMDVQLELHFCPSLQEKFGLPAVVYEPFSMIYPKLHARKENS